MIDFFSWVTSVFATSAVATGVVIFFGRTWVQTRLQEGIKAEYAEQLETLRADLKLKADERVAELQSTLAVASTARTAAFTNVFDRRVSAIAAIHSTLLDLNGRLTDYIAGFNSEENLDKCHKDVLDAFAAFEPKYRENLIFLPEGLARDLAKLKQEHVSITNVFRFMVHKKDNPMAAQQHLQLLERLNEDVPKSMEALQAAMRAILDGDKITISKVTVMNTPN